MSRQKRPAGTILADSRAFHRLSLVRGFAHPRGEMRPSSKLEPLDEKEFWHHYSRFQWLAPARWILAGLVDVLLYVSYGGTLFLANAVFGEDEVGASARGGRGGRLILRRSASTLSARAYDGVASRWRRFLPEPVGNVALDDHGFVFRPTHLGKEAASGEIGIDWAKIDHLILVPVGRDHLGVSCAVRDLGRVCLWLPKDRAGFLRVATAHIATPHLQSMG
jgi:hypothetical protein